MPLCSNTAARSCDQLRLVAIAVAGGEQHHLAARLGRRLRGTAGGCSARFSRRRALLRMKVRQRRAADPRAASCRAACAASGLRLAALTSLGHHRDAGDAPDRVGRGQQAVAETERAFGGARPPWRAASGAENRRSRGAAARTDTWSCSTCRTGNSDPRPSSRRACRRHRAPRSPRRRWRRTASERPGTG